MMALYFDDVVKEDIEFDDFLDQLRCKGNNIFSEENMWSTKLALQKLFNNRHFLTYHFNSLLKDSSNQNLNPYTFQVFMLAQEEHFSIRAPIWLPALGGELDAAFTYGDLHDHNFDLMTLGYMGSGYKTDIYQYDTDKVIGFESQPVKLYNKRTYQLKPGSIIYMGTNCDVHSQHAPNELSISLNILKTSGSSNRQFLDLKTKKVRKQTVGEVAPLFFKLASFFGDENTIDIVESLSSSLKGKYIKQKDDCIEHILGKKGLRSTANS